MKRNHLFVIAAIIWGIPGVSITVKGIAAYRENALENIWWLLLITFAVCVGFYFIFNRIVVKYSERISALPDKVNPLMTFPVRGWILLVFMMGLGIMLNYIPDIPVQFTASFYCGLGPMLIFSALKFVRTGVEGIDFLTK